MNGYKLDARGRRTRQVTIAELEATVSEVPGPYFPLAITPPRSPKSTNDGSPRESAARYRLVWTVPQDVSVAGRIAVHDGQTYELLTDPRPLRLGASAVGFEAECLPVDVLYPREAEIEGLPSAEPVPLSLYTGTETVEGHGDYDTYEGEAPIEFADALLAPNTVLISGERRLRLVEAIVVYEVPHVRMRLRSG